MSSFGCPQCDELFPSADKLEMHLAYHHDREIDGIALEKDRIGDGKDFERLKCQQCNQEYIWPRRLVARVKKGTFWCWACRFPFERPIFNEI